MGYLNKLILTVLCLSVSVLASALASVDQAAPKFSATDSNGAKISLDQFAGKTVILEWTNHECPFVKKHYKSGNMQALQKKYTAEGVVWLSVISSAKGKQGHLSGEKANSVSVSSGGHASHILLDESGELGKLYGAKTTPHMYIIDGKGMLRYMGAIDSIRSTDADDIPESTNYVTQAMSELAAGKSVSEQVTAAYGCSVKY
ncbi:Glutathione peroxidase [Alteromonadaceae bacterium Bs31]|nr:Glutathione peroxidase [Alteromonadaceae bacterium Bs31]